jgi:hypothetical protein
MPLAGRAPLRQIALVAVALVLSTSLAFALEQVAPGAFDFIGIYASAHLVATGHGASVADAEAIRATVGAIEPRRVDVLNNANLPVTSLLLAPLGLLPFGTAYVVMLAIDALALAASGLLLARGATKWLVASFILLAPPSIIALAHGQTTPLVFLGLVASQRLSGVASGLALGSAVLRPQILPLYAILALGDRGRVAGLAVAVAAAAGISLAVIGTAGVPGYLAIVLASASERGNDELGLAALVQRIGLGAVAPAITALVLSLLLLAVGAVAVLRARDRFASAGVWALLAAPHALLHDLVFAYPAVDRGRAPLTALVAATGIVALLLQLLGLPLLNVWLLGLALLAGRDRSPR